MPTAPGVGVEFAGYRIDRLLGRGGVGLVYLAQDLRLPRNVALKILSAELADDARFRERFVRESRLAASIDHHNIVPIYEAGESDGVLYLAMRFVPGIDLLRLLLQEGTLDPDRTLAIVAQVADALDAAHAEGLVHRDVKPGNILIVPRTSDDGTDHAYLADFGITKRMATDAGLTGTGQFVGSADYVAPEQIMGANVDGRADIYSLGCVLYQCLAGTRPFERDNDVATLYAHLSDPRPVLSTKRHDLPPEIDAVIAKAMAQKPEDRHPSAAALVSAARRALHRDERPAVPAETSDATPTVVASRLAHGEQVSAATEDAPVPTVVAEPQPPSQQPAWTPAPSRPAQPRRTGPPPGVAVAIAAAVVVVAVALVLVVVRGHSSSSPADVVSMSPSAPTTPTATGLAGMLLTTSDFPQGTVTSIPPALQLAQVGCGSSPIGKTDERSVAFQGQGSSGQLGYFDGAVSFATPADAHAYMDSLSSAVQACSGKLATQPSTPALGDRSVRVVFPSSTGQFTYDALYLNRGKFVSLVLVSMTGTTAPPPDAAVTYGRVVLQHMTDAGA